MMPDESDATVTTLPDSTALFDLLNRKITTHQFRPWSECGGRATPFDGACGDCGRHHNEHPIPRLVLNGKDAEVVARQVLQITGQERGASDGDD